LTRRTRTSRARRSSRPHTPPRRWSQRVTETSNALDLERHVFSRREPRQIALSLKRSAERSRRRKSEPLRSAMSMLTFFINRAGRSLDPSRRRILERTKLELRKLFEPADRARRLARPLQSRPSLHGHARGVHAMPRYDSKSKKTVSSAMRRRKKGTLRSGRGGKKVTSRKQAIAIGLSEARRKGARVPPNPHRGSKKSSRRKSTRRSSRSSSSRR
jgi:hypothetical protein